MTNRPYVNIPHIGFEQPTEGGTYPIGELIAPEQNEALNSLYDQLKALEGLSMPDRVLEPDRTLDIKVFPFADSSDATRFGVNQGSGKRTKPQERDLNMLFEMRDEWGNGSEVVGCKLGSTTEAGKKLQDKNYWLLLIKDKDGEVDRMVAESLENENALFVWRRDASETDNWQEVINHSKDRAGKLGAVALNRSNRSMKERVEEKLTAPVEEFKADRAKRKKNQVDK